MVTKPTRTALLTLGLLTLVLAGGAAVAQKAEHGGQSPRIQEWKSTDETSAEPRLIGQDARIVVDGDPDRPVMLAGVEGRLRYYVPDRCLVIDVATTAPLRTAKIDSDVPPASTESEPLIREARVPGQEVSWFSAVWPYGTAVISDGDRFGIRLVDGSTYWAGDRIEGGGGAWGENKDGVAPTFGLPENCIGQDLSQLVPDPAKAR